MEDLWGGRGVERAERFGQCPAFERTSIGHQGSREKNAKDWKKRILSQIESKEGGGKYKVGMIALSD